MSSITILIFDLAGGTTGEQVREGLGRAGVRPQGVEMIGSDSAYPLALVRVGVDRFSAPFLADRLFGASTFLGRRVRAHVSLFF